MNFDSFLPGDLKDALNRELEILQQTAMQGTMDTLKDTNEEEEWEMAASGSGCGTDGDDDIASNHSSPIHSAKSSWSDKSDKQPAAAGTDRIVDQKPKPQPRKLPPFMSGTKKTPVEPMSEVSDATNGDVGVSVPSPPPTSAAAAALFAVQQSQSASKQGKQGLISPNQFSDDSFSFSEARNQVLDRMNHETDSLTSSEFTSFLNQENDFLVSPIPHDKKFHNPPHQQQSFRPNDSGFDSSYDSIDRALFSPGQSSDSMIPSTPYSPDTQHVSQHRQPPSYSMHSQVEAFIQGKDEVLPRNSLVEAAANKNLSYPAPSNHLYRGGVREPNPYLKGLDPLHSTSLKQGGLLPPYHTSRNSSSAYQGYLQGGGDSDEDRNDPILASIHNRNYLSDQIKQHEQRSKNTKGSYLSSDKAESVALGGLRNDNIGDEGRMSIFENQNDEESSWLSEQSFVRSVNASPHDPFKQLLVNAGIVNSNSGWFNPNNSRYAQWLALWEEWRYTAYIFAPGIALMALYFKFSYAEEIN